MANVSRSAVVVVVPPGGQGLGGLRQVVDQLVDLREVPIQLELLDRDQLDLLRWSLDVLDEHEPDAAGEQLLLDHRGVQRREVLRPDGVGEGAALGRDALADLEMVASSSAVPMRYSWRKLSPTTGAAFMTMPGRPPPTPASQVPRVSVSPPVFSSSFLVASPRYQTVPSWSRGGPP